MSDLHQIELQKSKIGYGIKIWLTFEGKSILGAGWAKLLETINKKEVSSLTEAAKECGYSYKYAWNILKRIENRTGISPVITSKGGKGGGGSVRLSEWGDYLRKKFKHLNEEIKDVKERLEF
ncbi:MAG: ModE family transcriptional regulator [Promethearchaeota archaeon]|nr:MAG: ModE family transcriptional regulator [Candidatus Lokiarchaeota archaeon]